MNAGANDKTETADFFNPSENYWFLISSIITSFDGISKQVFPLYKLLKKL